VLQEEKAQMSQPNIRGQTASNPSEVWGDAMLRKGQHICWIGLLNPTGFTVHGGSAKDNQISEFIAKSEFDIVNFPEVNECWHKVIPRNRLEERTLRWFKTLHRSVAYNYADTKVQ